MNVLYLTLEDFDSIVYSHSINADLLREFTKHGHDVFIVSPVERRKHIATQLKTEGNASFLKLRIGNIQKTNLFEKGISTLTIERKVITGLKKYYPSVSFDLILYCTPPITFLGAVRYIKKRDNAKTYLLLKDIFPQNAVDIGILSKTGLKGLIYKFFRKQEKELYALSDRIGCMSQANVDYVIKHNPEVDPSIVEVCPNSIEVVDKSVEGKTKIDIRTRYGIPLDKIVFVYGGNLGKPQGIPFLIECLKNCKDVDDVFFLIVGDGTEYHLLERFIEIDHPKNVKLLKRLPKEDYDNMVGACDVGLILLDYRFTIPNFPSRLLSYMQAKLPVFACTDPNTDIGTVITEGGFGWWCASNDVDAFKNQIKVISKDDFIIRGIKGFTYLSENYSVQKAFGIIGKYEVRG